MFPEWVVGLVVLSVPYRAPAADAAERGPAAIPPRWGHPVTVPPGRHRGRARGRCSAVPSPVPVRAVRQRPARPGSAPVQRTSPVRSRTGQHAGAGRPAGLPGTRGLRSVDEQDRQRWGRSRVSCAIEPAALEEPADHLCRVRRTLGRPGVETAVVRMRWARALADEACRSCSARWSCVRAKARTGTPRSSSSPSTQRHPNPGPPPAAPVTSTRPLTRALLSVHGG